MSTDEDNENYDQDNGEKPPEEHDQDQERSGKSTQVYGGDERKEEDEQV